jgi:hypothetical protein
MKILAAISALMTFACACACACAAAYLFLGWPPFADIGNYGFAGKYIFYILILGSLGYAKVAIALWRDGSSNS